jgi:hypothetical protein
VLVAVRTEGPVPEPISALSANNILERVDLQELLPFPRRVDGIGRLGAGTKLEAAQIPWPIMMLLDRIGEGPHVLADLDDLAPTDAERVKLSVARAYLLWGYDPGDAHLRVLDDTLARVV